MRYEKATEGIRVRVRPRFSLADSDPQEGSFVFSYTVNVANESESTAQLLFRHWRIHDAVGEDSEVDGEGVVGEQPVLRPGETHEYRSFCVLRSPLGYMEGHYTFARPTGERFKVEVPRFYLNGPFVIPSPSADLLPEEEGDPGPMH